VPKSDVPGEQTWPTQPFPTNPPPFARQAFTEKDISPYIDDPAEKARFLEDIRNARNEGMFTPVGLERYTMEMPGNNGGSNFGSAATDPAHATVFVVSKDWPALLKLSAPPNATPQPDGSIPYESPFGFMVTTQGMPAIAPPWTSLTAFDLTAGTIKWKIPVGEVPELAAKGITNTGSQFPKVGPVVTAGGLIFTGTRDKKIRAFDVDTGKLLWTFEVEAGIEGMPAVYQVNGKQYLVYCAAASSSTRTHAPFYAAPAARGLTSVPDLLARGDGEGPVQAPAGGARGGGGGRAGRGGGAPIAGAYVAFALPDSPRR
jgi:glucose dehydrogenase